MVVEGGVAAIDGARLATGVEVVNRRPPHKRRPGGRSVAAIPAPNRGGTTDW